MSKPKEDTWLEELAKALIGRHLQVSLPDLKTREDQLDSAFWRQSKRRLRCIAVVGAGASAPALPRGNELASSLIRKFNIPQAAVEAERERLERITAVDPTEFEAQLSAIGQALGNSRRVQLAISQLYRLRYPTVLAYELLAHLLKHRFLDAVINMNFDELLDQSLEDELGSHEYERIVSDRDCIGIQSNVLADDYVPLYIKLHGTASEPESLRFTRESYYDSPLQVATEAARLFQVPECLVLNLGFGMTNFDLHRLLALPEHLWLYNLSYDPLSGKARTAITREREARCAQDAKDQESKAVAKGDGCRGRKTRFQESPENERKSKESGEHQQALEPSPASDLMMNSLLAAIEGQMQAIQRHSFAVDLRSADRHRTVANLLGPDSGPGQRMIELPHNPDDASASLDPIVRAAQPTSVNQDYLLRRTILELSLTMARTRGLVSIASLASDRGGLCYDAYARQAGRAAIPWRDLYAQVGFRQNREAPDVLEAIEGIRAVSQPATPEALLRDDYFPDIGSRAWKEWHELPVLDMTKVTDRVLPYIVDNHTEAQRTNLIETLQGLYEETEYEIHSRDDRVCSKTFSYPMILKTMSAFGAYSFELVERAGASGVAASMDIISETGEWLLKDRDVFQQHIRDTDEIRLIVAFLRRVPELDKRFPGIKIRYQQPWHHNRHLVILKSKRESSALYFARHHRTAYVTPVLLRDQSDIDILKTTFENRWNNSHPVLNAD